MRHTYTKKVKKEKHTLKPNKRETTIKPQAFAFSITVLLFFVSSCKSFKIKQFLAKKQKQNHPIPPTNLD